MHTYSKNTASLIEFYRQRGNLVPVVAKGSPEEICARTINDLQRTQLAANRRLASTWVRLPASSHPPPPFASNPKAVYGLH
jgi:hypothetical protein